MKTALLIGGLVVASLTSPACAQYYGYGGYGGYGGGYYGGPSSDVLADRVYRNGYGDSTRVTVTRGSRFTCRTVSSKEFDGWGDRVRRRKSCRPNY